MDKLVTITAVKVPTESKWGGTFFTSVAGDEITAEATIAPLVEKWITGKGIDSTKEVVVK